jgi:hypothetical protein
LALSPVLLLLAPLLAQQEGRPERGGGRVDGGEGGPDGGETVEGADLLVARRVAPPRPLAEAARFEGVDRERTQPAMAASPDGGAWLVCREWRGGLGDFVVAQRLDADLRVAATIEIDDAPAWRDAPCCVLLPDGALLVAFAEMKDDVAQIVGARIEGEAVAQRYQFTGGTAPARDPALALAADGTAWLAWEQWVGAAGGGSFDLHAAPLGSAPSLSLGAPQSIAAGPGSELDPVLALAGATLWIGWCGFVGNDYEVSVRPLSPAGPELQVSAEAKADDLHPALAGGADGTLWIAWDRLVDSRRGSSPPADSREEGHAGAVEQSVRVMVAAVREGVVSVEAGSGETIAGEVPGAALLGWGGGVPALAIDRGGRPWLATRHLVQSTSRDRRAGHLVLLQVRDDGVWSPAHELAESGGACDAAALAPVGSGMAVAAQADRRMRTGSLWNAAGLPGTLKKAATAAGDEFATWTGPSALSLGVGQAGAFAAAADEGEEHGGRERSRPWVAQVARRETPHVHPAGIAAADPFVSGAERHQLRLGERRMTVFYGDLHRHSSLSRCSRGIEPMPEDRYAAARDVWRDDFLAVTDHAGHMDPGAWARLGRLLAFERTPTLVPLRGYECSTQSQGHFNVIFATQDAPLLSIASNPREGALQWLSRRLADRAALVIPHTSADPGRLVDFRECDPRLTRLVEIYQSLRGSFEFDGCWRQSARALRPGSFAADALAVLPQLGFIASSDHGSGAAYAAVLSERLDAPSLFEALSAGRCFATTLRGLLVDVRIGDAWMGESAVLDAAPTIRLATRMVQPIRDVLVVKDGRPWRRLGRDAEPTQRELNLHFELTEESVPPRRDFALELEIAGGRLLLGGAAARGRDATRPGFEPLEREDDAAPTGIRFRWPKGARHASRDGHRLRARVTREASFTVASGGQRREVSLADALRDGISGRGQGVEWRVRVNERHDLAVAEQPGLGVSELVQEWRDDELSSGASATYYVRVIQADGECAWSSPIRVTRR